jgi:hypothetical protein
MSGARSDNPLGLPRWAWALVAVVVGVNMVFFVVDLLFGGPGGPRSSSLATSGDGLAAYSDLLGLNDHPATAARRNEVGPTRTAILAEPEGFDQDAADALRRFVQRGGRLIAGGPSAVEWLEFVTSDAPSWGPSEPARFVADPSASDTKGISSIEAASGGVWTDFGSWRAVVGEPPSVLIAEDDVGDGTVVAIADVSFLHNANLARADNAAFGLVLAGEDDRPVSFLESVHGYGDARGWSAIPVRWRWAIAGVGMAALVFMWARGRRLGPPEAATRPPPPPRRAYVDALAGALARTKGEHRR